MNLVLVHWTREPQRLVADHSSGLINSEGAGSFGLRTRHRALTSSLAMRMSSVTSEKTVGWMNSPFCPQAPPPHSSFAPSFFPLSISSRILSYCALSIWRGTQSQWKPRVFGDSAVQLNPIQTQFISIQMYSLYRDHGSYSLNTSWVKASIMLHLHLKVWWDKLYWLLDSTPCVCEENTTLNC